jgi:hypothetical protein
MRNRQGWSRLASSLIGLGLAATAPFPLATIAAYAHHSTALFDATRRETVTGTVSKVEWANPHTYIFMVVNKDGVDQTWSIISGTPQLNIRNGWKRDDVKVGDKVTIVINPQRDGGPAGILCSIKLPDGRTLEGPRDFLVVPKAG